MSRISNGFGEKRQRGRFFRLWAALSVALASAFAPAQGQERERVVPESRAEMQLSFAPVVAEVAPAVVNIYTRTVVRAQTSPFFNDPFFRRFFGDNFDFGVPRERVQSSLGSGVVVDPGGLIITNNHVVNGASEIIVALSDRREFEAEVVLSEERTDLAVLKIDTKGEELPYLEFADSDQVQVGDIVLAIGNPFGVGQTVTNGIVSALARTNVGISDFQFFIQTDAAINPGNSGGALVGLDGKLVGVNTAIYSRSGGSNGIGFAIPSNMVRTIVEGADGSGIHRPWLGASGQNVTRNIADSVGLDRPVGVLLNEIYETGPADRAGLRVGDIILRVGDKDVLDPEGLQFMLATKRIDDEIGMTVFRDGKRFSVDFPLEAPPEIPPRNETELSGRHPFDGATLANLSPALAEELGLNPLKDGVVIVELNRRGHAARVGFRPGDSILAVNGEQIETVEELANLVQTHEGGWRITMRRNNRILELTL